MDPQQIAQTVSQHQDELRALRARTAHARQARRNQPASRRHPIRHRAGWALVWIGLRVAHAAGED